MPSPIAIHGIMELSKKNMDRESQDQSARATSGCNMAFADCYEEWFKKTKVQWNLEFFQTFYPEISNHDHDVEETRKMNPNKRHIKNILNSFLQSTLSWTLAQRRSPRSPVSSPCRQHFDKSWILPSTFISPLLGLGVSIIISNRNINSVSVSY